jgi:hypothetical protein
MTPASLEVGKPYPGTIPDHDASVFEFSKEGPELRLFFSGIPDDVVRHVQDDDCYLGLLRSGELAVVPWRIGEVMSGDAQFHIYLYTPEARPMPQALDDNAHYEVQITLADRATGMVKALRRVRLSTALSKVFNEVIAFQQGNQIQREKYDAQVDIYQNQYPSVADAIAAAPIFEKTEPCRHAA